MLSLFISVALDDFILEEKGLILSRSLPLHPSELATAAMVGGAGVGASLNRQTKEPSYWITKVRDLLLRVTAACVCHVVLSRKRS